MMRALACLVIAMPIPALLVAAEPKKNELPASVREIVANADLFEILSLDPGMPGRPAAMPANALREAKIPLADNIKR
jgi:hypothetical protein